MELYDVMRSTPTTRYFEREPVSPATIERVLDNARFAPSGGNRQGWRVVVVDDDALRRAIRDLYLPHWNAYMEATGGARVLADQSLADAHPARVRALRAADDFARSLHEVPVHILVCAELDALALVDAQLDRPSIVGGASIYPFTHNVLLGLRNEGLGAAFVTIVARAEAELRELLGLPRELIVAGLIAVGHRRDPWPARLSRRAVSDFASHNKYGRPFGEPTS